MARLFVLSPNTGGRSWAISKYSKVKDATAVVLEFISSPEQSLEDRHGLQDTSWIPGATHISPLRNSAPPSRAQGEYLDAIKESFTYTVPDPQIPGSNEYRLRLSEAVSKALQKSVSPKEALDQAAEEWDKITKRRSLRKQKEFWKQQVTAMKEAGVTFRPELADK